MYPGGPGRHSWGRPASQPMRLQQAQGSLCTFCLLSASCQFTCFSLAGCSWHAQGRTTGPLTGRWRAVIATSSSKWCTPGGGAWSGPAHRQGGRGLQEVLALLMQQMAFQCHLLPLCGCACHVWLPRGRHMGTTLSAFQPWPCSNKKPAEHFISSYCPTPCRPAPPPPTTSPSGLPLPHTASGQLWPAGRQPWPSLPSTTDTR